MRPLEAIESDITTNLLQQEHLTAEHRLLIAIIVRSILDYLDDTAVPHCENQTAANYTKGRAHWEAREFFFPKEIFSYNKPPPFSFLWISQHLSDDPQCFMSKVRKLLRTAPKRSAIIAKYGRYAPGRITDDATY